MIVQPRNKWKRAGLNERFPFIVPAVGHDACIGGRLVAAPAGDAPRFALDDVSSWLLRVAFILIIGDLAFAPINGIGRFPHPPFPTSAVAALAAGIGEETIFRLFFISVWTWLISNLILRGRLQAPVYAVFSVFSAIAFGFSHLPAIMALNNWATLSQVPPVLLAELLLLNGIMGLVAAYAFKKWGFLAPVGVHFWADVVWHVIWGLF